MFDTLRNTFRHTLPFCVFTILALFSSCKNKWKEPVDVNFNFTSTQKNSSVSSLQSGEIFIDSASIGLSSFTFNGEREQGSSNISFSEKNVGSISIINGATKNFTIKKQIPQGTYTKMTFVVETSSVSLKGLILTDDYGVVPFYFNYEVPQFSNVLAKPNSGAPDVILEHGKETNAMVNFDISTLFLGIGTEIWRNVNYEEISGQPQGQPNRRININNSENTTLYLNIANKIQSITGVTFY